MDDRVLADAFLCDLATSAGAPFTSGIVGAIAQIGARVVVMALPAGIRALATERSIHVAALVPEALAVGLSQLLLLRAKVGHGDGDVAALSHMLG